MEILCARQGVSVTRARARARAGGGVEAVTKHDVLQHGCLAGHVRMQMDGDFRNGYPYWNKGLESGFGGSEGPHPKKA
eukprot:1138003-Pelagomonas_calceolata.AAC.5